MTTATLPELSINTAKARASLGRDARAASKGVGDAEVEIDGHHYRIVITDQGPPEWWRSVEGRFEDEVRWQRCSDDQIPTGRKLTLALVAALQRAEEARFAGPREIR